MNLQGKVCNTCNEHKPFSEFSKKRDSTDGLRSYCKSCANDYQINMNPFVKWFSSRKGQAKLKGKEFTILPTDIPGVKIREVITKGLGRNKYGTFVKKYTSWEATEYPKVCPVLGIELDWKAKVNGGQNNSPSLDRIDSTKDYIPGNVMIMSRLANVMKNNATLEQLKQFSRYHLFGE